MYKIFNEHVFLGKNNISITVPTILTHDNNPYMDKYQRSHKLLKLYADSNNINGIKNELCVLWNLYVTMDKKSKNKKYKDTANKVKTFVMNDFKVYLTIVQSAEPNFNFQEYYKNSPYCNEYINITPEDIKLLKKFLSVIL